MNPHNPPPLVLWHTNTSHIPHYPPMCINISRMPHVPLMLNKQQLYGPESVVSADRRYFIGLHSRHFDDKGCFDPKAL